MHAADHISTPSTAPTSRRTGRILAVEDDSIMARIATSLLRAEGHTVQTAASGLAALDLAERDPPDLVLLDYMMPGMNGEETCRRLKANPETRRIPVIMVTAEDSTEKVRDCLGLGAADYVRKPYAPSELMARVRTHLELSWTERDLHEWKQRVSADLRLGGLVQKDLASAPPLLGRSLQARAEFRPSLHVGVVYFTSATPPAMASPPPWFRPCSNLFSPSCCATAPTRPRSNCATPCTPT